MTEMRPYFLSVAEWGRLNALSRSTAYELAAAGRVRTVKLGGRTLVPIAEADRFAAELLASAGITLEEDHAD